MYGYTTEDGHMGNERELMLFASDEEYREYLRDSRELMETV